MNLISNEIYVYGTDICFLSLVYSYKASLA